MSSLPITGAFNDAYVQQLYESYRRDPASVDEYWRQFFRFAERLAGAAPSGGAGAAASPELLRAVAGAAGLVDAIRHYGHLAVPVDPLGTPPLGAAELTPEFHGITEGELARVPAAALGFDGGSAADVVARLRELYCTTIGFEFEHLEDETEREWFRRQIEDGQMERLLSPEEKQRVLRRLTEVDAFERFLGRVYLGYKRFSIEGSDALVPMLDAAAERAAEHGAQEIAIGMAHRGRLNVLAHNIGKPYATIFEEFEGKHAATNAVSDTGDVKYHLGYASDRTLANGKTVHVLMTPNPSHLDFVDPVLEGVTRADQRVEGAAPGTRDEHRVLPILVHGDAAFIGEGIVAETLNLSRLRGYRTGGTLHIIVNNQVGFTTDPADARSTYYASDLAKGFDVPILHVNGDDAESCIAAVRLGIAWRERFGKDFLIDLVSYRRHGHNETDEPAFTQPTLYARVREHPTPREVWAARLVRERVIAEADAQQIERDVMALLDRINGETKAALAQAPAHAPERVAAGSDGNGAPGPTDTAVRRETLVALNERLLAWPPGFRVNPKLARSLERRREALEGHGIDWGHAESLAFASLLTEGTSVRLTGQDVERGTFSHRQTVLHDVERGDTYTPLQNLPHASGVFEIYNSPLSETAVMAFEYGYSTVAPDTLVLWEAQFGDFANVAQPIVDQFISAGRAKWGQESGIVLLLPHGYEGQGPEHSSARLERYLQMCAEGNMVVAYPSTPAQYFHILRRQARRADRVPLILMQPKSLLRLPAAAASLADLAEGRFQPVIDDPEASERREEVRRIVFCTGKIYYDLTAKAERPASIAIVRVEELYPWPHEDVARIVDLYPAVEEVVWAQEEPKNMGAWTYVSPRLRASTGTALPIRYIGRPERASPAEGYQQTHQHEQQRIITEALTVPQGSTPKRRGAAAR